MWEFNSWLSLLCQGRGVDLYLRELHDGRRDRERLQRTTCTVVMLR